MRGWSGRRLALLLRTEGGLTPSIKRLGGGGGRGRPRKKNKTTTTKKKQTKIKKKLLDIFHLCCTYGLLSKQYRGRKPDLMYN